MKDDCQKPDCYDPADETYKGENGNTVKVCERHYYQLVTGKTPLTATITGSDSSINTASGFDLKTRTATHSPGSSDDSTIEWSDAR